MFLIPIAFGIFAAYLIIVAVALTVRLIVGGAFQVVAAVRGRS